MNLRALWTGIAFAFLSVCAGAGPVTIDWKEIDEALAKGLPKTAIEKLEPIIPAAIAEKEYAVATRALVQKINLESQLQGGGSEERITRLEASLVNQPEPMRPILQTVLADWYWQYFQENRWSFAQRTQQLGESGGGDLRTWDLAHILRAIDDRFAAVLEKSDALKHIPISDYSVMLQDGIAPDEYRPTLYDLIAHEALRFYQAGEQGVDTSENAFEIEAKGPIFGTSKEFSSWTLESADADSHQGKAIRLYQSLMAFHRDDPSALADLDLARIVYGGEVAVGSDRTSRLTAALERFVSEHANEEFASRVLFHLAEIARSQSDLVRAHQFAERGSKASPQSIGALECRAILDQIESKSISIQAESVWTAPWPSLAIRYRNQNKIYFRAVEMDFDALFAKTRWNPRLPIEDRKEVLHKKPLLTWSADLPVTNDYREHDHSVAVPKTLPPGFYAIVASADPDFRDEDNWLSIATIWVSDLAMILRNERDGAVGGFILNAREGFPIQSARVKTWALDSRGARREGPELTTDQDGHFEIKEQDQQIFFSAEKDGHRVVSANYAYNFNRSDEPRRQTRTVFFLDRAIYRPGQTIAYKGIALENVKGKFRPAAKRSVTVFFRDANNQEVAHTSLVTNAYGSFNGTFTAPRDRLLGGMSLTAGDDSGSASFHVEEYKRPKFQVAINPPTQAPKLDSEVDVIGTATAYTGAAIGSARVAWRVERGVSWPAWAWWYGKSGTTAIAHGTTVTNSDGTFTVHFRAEPDRVSSADTEPAFTYQIHADVTDLSGETRSAERVLTAGYTALRAEIDADEWLTAGARTKLSLRTTSLDGESTAAAGEIHIYEVKQPDQVQRADLETRYYPGAMTSWSKDSVESWPLAREIHAMAFHTEADGKTSVDVSPLPAGFYRAELTTTDAFGKAVTARKTLQVIDPRATQLGLKVPNAFASPSWSVQPGDTFSAVWGTGYSRGRAFIEVSCEGRMLQSYWTAADRTEAVIGQLVTEDMRGGFTVRATFLAENRLYVNERTVDVPWTNKELHLRWESFRSKLVPGAKESWSLRVEGPDAKRASAEMVATLYDASLDQFAANSWPTGFDVFRAEGDSLNPALQNMPSSFQIIRQWNSSGLVAPMWTYSHFRDDLVFLPLDENIVLSPFVVEASSDAGYAPNATLAGSRIRTDLRDTGGAIAAVGAAPKIAAPSAITLGGRVAKEPGAPRPNLAQISARKNLNETAFFYPLLTTDDQGVIKIQFTMPEALTQWKFLGFAHDRELRSGLITDTVVTSKDLMVQPNPPRFLREGDVIEFSVKVSNQSDVEQTGSVQVNFSDASSLRPVDQDLENIHPLQAFAIPAKQSRSFAWKVTVPGGLDFLTFKAVAASAQTSDGEEGYLPVLSRRVLVTESLPISVRGPTTKTFSFDKLLSSGSSTTLKNQVLNVQMTARPAWNAVLALPYLMEYPYECSEQLFNRYYANALAASVAASDPKIRRVFDEWRNTPTLKSPLEKNADLTSIALEETPWVLEAQSESTARRRVGLLFDENRLSDESARALQKLAERQGSDGLWAWFPGGPTSDYISLYIVAGFGRLRHLDANVDISPAKRALRGLDEAMERRYEESQKDQQPASYPPSGLDIMYLYGRSFFLADSPIAATHQKALDYFQRQARKHWVQLDSRQNQAQLAVALQRFGDHETPIAILKSLKERSLRGDELGMYWREGKTGWWRWDQAPIETQAIMIEAFDEVTHDEAVVDDCRIWLLQQKRTQNWETTKATADAVYALLLRGHSLLGDQQVDVELGGKPLVPGKVEAGTGFFEEKFVRGEIQPQMGEIKVTKKDIGLSWGSVTWQYLEDVANVSSASTADGLTVKKRLFVKRTTAQGQTLIPVSGAVAIGDELVVRIELNVDRDLEFVHLKDQRGSGTEPVSVLSGYAYQDGTGYYESTRDTATHFFFDSLRRGVYVFEYSTRVQLAGRYETGLAEVECMYAPEFSAHSESVKIEAKSTL